MKRAWKTLRAALEAFDAEDETREPRYDPAHLGAAIVLALIAIGVLYWILWTLLVYEGGLFSKLAPTARVLLGASPSSLGYKGPWDRGPWEGWLGNLGALAAAAAVLKTLHRLYGRAAGRAGR